MHISIRQQTKHVLASPKAESRYEILNVFTYTYSSLLLITKVAIIHAHVMYFEFVALHIGKAFEKYECIATQLLPHIKKKTIIYVGFIQDAAPIAIALRQE